VVLRLWDVCSPSSAAPDVISAALAASLSRRFHPQYFVTRTGVT
jgi:hypothetical protein